MDRVKIALNFHRKRKHAVMHSFAQAIHDGMVAQAGVYPSPMPTVATFQTHVADYLAAIDACGTKGNRGPHSALAVRDAAAETVKDDLRRYATYCQTTTPNDKVNFEIAGFGTLKQGHHAAAGVLAAPGNLHSKITVHTLSGETPLAWDVVAAAHSYNVYSSDAPDGIFVFIATVTEAKYTAVGTPGVLKYFTVRGVGSAGEGVETAALGAHSSF